MTHDADRLLRTDRAQEAGIGTEVRNLVDTSIAAKILNHAKAALGTLLAQTGAVSLVASSECETGGSTETQRSVSYFMVPRSGDVLPGHPARRGRGRSVRV